MAVKSSLQWMTDFGSFFAQQDRGGQLTILLIIALFFLVGMLASSFVWHHV